MQKKISGEDMRADRLVSIILLLQNKGRMTSAVLARELGVSRRTILRDIDALSLSGVPLWAEGGHGGGFALDEGYRTSLTGLKEAEIRSLFVGGNAPLLADLGMGAEAQQAERKLSASLPDRYRESVAFVQNRVLIDPRWWWHEKQASPFLEPLQTAVFGDLTVHADYEHFDKQRESLTLRPYGIVAKSGLWYLVAHNGEEFRCYRVSRFLKVDTPGSTFARDPAFDLQSWWPENARRFAAAFSGYRCVLDIAESRLGYVQWLAPGRSEPIGPAPGREGFLRVELGVESQEMALLIAFGLAEDCRIVEPLEMKTAFIARAQAAAAQT